MSMTTTKIKIPNGKHVSLDSETWDTEPGADIRSIGATFFDPLTKRISMPGDFKMTPGGKRYLTFYAACDNPIVRPSEMGWCDPVTMAAHLDPTSGLDVYRKYALKRSQKTVDWWADQEDAAQAAFANPLDLEAALLELSYFIHSLSDHIVDGQARDICVWSHGPAFDPPIIETAYRVLGIPVPWFYRAHRDTRTVFDDAGIDDHSAFMKCHRYGVFHHSLHDAISQARAITAAKMLIDEQRRDALQMRQFLNEIRADIRARPDGTWPTRLNGDGFASRLEKVLGFPN